MTGLLLWNASLPSLWLRSAEASRLRTVAVLCATLCGEGVARTGLVCCAPAPDAGPCLRAGGLVCLGEGLVGLLTLELELVEETRRGGTGLRVYCGEGVVAGLALLNGAGRQPWWRSLDEYFGLVAVGCLLVAVGCLGLLNGWLLCCRECL